MGTGALHLLDHYFQDMPYSYAQTVNKNHGRIELGQCWVLSDPPAFEVIHHYDA